MTISSSAQKIRDDPNAGGSSVISEVLSFEIFNKALHADLLKTEMEVKYVQKGPMTDYVCRISNQIFGVSVTRAMKYKKEFTKQDAFRLLTKKLEGIIQSNKNSGENISKQSLHIWTSNQQTTNDIVTVYNDLPDDIRSNTIVFVTRTDHSSCIFKVERNQNSRNRKSRHSSSKGSNPKSVHIIKPTE